MDDIKQRIKELEKQDKFWENMARSRAIDPAYAYKARQEIKQKLEAATQEQRKLRKLKNKQSTKQNFHEPK